METVILTSLHHLVYNETEIIRFNEATLEKFNTKQELIDQVGDPDILGVLGIVFEESILKSQYFYYKKKFSTKEDAERKASSIKGAIGWLSIGLWFIKDNSVTTTITWVYGKDSLKGLEINTQMNCNANGRFVDVNFTAQEIKHSFEYLTNYWKIAPVRSNLPKFDQNINSPIYQSELYALDYNDKNRHRIERAISFLKKARSTSQLAEKISFYVLVLECLFSANDGTEISHKIRERVARYIGDDKEQRIAIFNNIKKYYEIRSKYVHGQQLDKKYNKRSVMVPISIEIDELVRQVLSRIIMNDSEIFLKPELDLKEWFNEKLLN